MKIYDFILRGEEATEENAELYAKNFNFSKCKVEINPCPSMDYDYVNTINGINIYYNWKADYYFFSDINQ